MSALSVLGLVAGHAELPVLRGVDLTVPDGSLVALLGPSGCGKTTLLRVIAGLHRADAGVVSLGGEVLEAERRHVPTHRRRVTLVPQEAALFPHLDVASNVAFGLRGTADVDRRVGDLLELVGLAGLGGRAPHELSGGQQQRVALARALAPRPDLVLLDEPFSSLDAQLRDQLRDDVRELLRIEGRTALLVTHDQQEALAVADEVAVMRDGAVLQQSDPETLYRAPRHRWTAAFLGESTVLAAGPGERPTTSLGEVVVSGGTGSRVLVRPEDVAVVADGTPGVVTRRWFRGHEWLAEVSVDGGPVLVRSRDVPPVGSAVRLAVTAAVRRVED